MGLIVAINRRNRGKLLVINISECNKMIKVNLMVVVVLVVNMKERSRKMIKMEIKITLEMDM